MKKRLLSAVLALAMVLTMLPLTVFATTSEQLTSSLCTTSNTDGTQKFNLVTVTFRAEGYQFQAASTGAPAVTAPYDGYYFWGKAPSTPTATTNTLYEAKDGVIASTGTSGSWYPSAAAALAAGVSSMKIIGTSETVNLAEAKAGSLSIDINGKTVNFTGSLDQSKTGSEAVNNTKLTSLTLTNSAKKNADGTLQGSISGSISATNQGFTLTATNVPATSGPNITLTNTTTTARTLTVTLTDSKVGDISVSKGAANIKVTGTTHGAAATGNITVNGTAPDNNFNYGSTSINVSGGKTGNIVINGKTGSGAGGINLSDTAEVGTITLHGGRKGESGAAATALPAWGGSLYVTIGSQCVTGAITEASGNEAVITVNANGGSGSTKGIDSIDFSGSSNAHSVTINGAKAGTIKMNAGTLNISGGANVGEVTLGKTNTPGKITANISGATTTVTSVDGSASQDVTLNITGGTISATSDCVKLPDNYAKHTITGGTFGSPIRKYAGWLKDVTYEIKTTDAKNNVTYTYTKSFQDCVNAYKNSSTGTTVTVVGAGDDPKLTATFYLDAPTDTSESADPKPEPVVVITTDANNGITLPSTINSKPVSTWYIDDEPIDAGALIKITKNTDVKATTSSADNSEIVSVTADYGEDKNTGKPGLAATLSGNTIKVSGALPANSSGFVDIDLLVETALGNKYQISVSYSVAEKKLLPGDLVTPYIRGKDNASIQVQGTNLFYSLDGSGLVVSAGEVEAITLKSTESVATVSVSGGNAEKAQLVAALEKTEADFTGSTAVQEAANKVVAGLTQNQVDTYIRNARITAWKAVPGHTGNPSETDISTMSKYNKLEVVLYLNIQATGWDRTVGSQSLNLNITPYYRLDVISSSDGDPITVKTGAALSMSGLTSEYGDVTVTLDSELTKLVSGLQWAHHGNYVYPINKDTGAFVTSHGFSPFNLNKVDPVAEVTTKRFDGKTETKLYYDNVQLAIDETVEGDTVKLYTVYSKTAETYSISGKARTITFDPGINGTFVPTFSGANTTAKKTDGNVWNVQLNTDTTPTTATISVGAATGGTGRASATSVVPGQSFTYTATPSSGYQASAPTARADNGATVSVIAAGANQWTITVPAGAKTVTVTPAFVLTTGLPFTDVTSRSAWYFNSVSYCYNTYATGTIRLMQGNSDGTFGIGRTLTRAQVAQMLYNLAGQPAVGAVAYPFRDVSNSSYYAYNAINWAARNGIAQGYGDGNFGPEDPVTREELVVFLWRYAKEPTYNTNLYAYTDGGAVHTWAVPAMRWATGMSILSGTNSTNLNGTISPFSPALREQVAVTVEKFHRLYG